MVIVVLAVWPGEAHGSDFCKTNMFFFSKHVLASPSHLHLYVLLSKHVFLWSMYNSGLYFCSVVLFCFGSFKTYVFYGVAGTVAAPGCSPRGWQPLNNLQFFNISLFGFIHVWFFVLKRILFSWQLFWAKRLSRWCVVHVSESWGEFLWVPFLWNIKTFFL